MTFASIHSDEERVAIYAAGFGNMWAGGLRPSFGQPFEWQDGTPWDYQFWRSNEPNNGGEMGLSVNHSPNGGWNDWQTFNAVRCLFAEPVGVTVSAKPNLIV